MASKLSFAAAAVRAGKGSGTPAAAADATPVAAPAPEPAQSTRLSRENSTWSVDTHATAAMPAYGGPSSTEAVSASTQSTAASAASSVGMSSPGRAGGGGGLFGLTQTMRGKGDETGANRASTGSGAGSNPFGAVFVARAAGKLKERAEKTRRGDYFLRLNPADSNTGPVGIPVREILQQIYHHKRDQTGMFLQQEPVCGPGYLTSLRNRR
jgi:hypothetical protein